MIEIKQGNAVEVLKTLSEDSIDMVYTCPSPMRYYDPGINKIGSEQYIGEYIINLGIIFDECSRVLKPTGNLFVQLGDQYNVDGSLMGIPASFEYIMMKNGWDLNDRLIWHRTETKKLKMDNEWGFKKNYEFIFHFIHKDYYFNTRSKYKNTSVFSYPLEDSYYTNEFDSGLPTELFKMVIDTTTKEGDTVLDPLCGSAKLGVVAKKMNRSFIGIDIDPEIVNLCRIRLGIE